MGGTGWPGCNKSRLSLQCFHFPNYFRIVLTVPQEMMLEAVDRIAAFCKAHYMDENKLVQQSESSLVIGGTPIAMEARG